MKSEVKQTLTLTTFTYYYLACRLGIETITNKKRVSKKDKKEGF